MPTTRFKGETAGERLDKSSISDSDMIQLRHKPGTIEDADKGISKAQLLSCPFGVSDTAAATAAKAADLTDSNPDFTLVSGREVVVCFTTANTASNPTLNFAGSGAIPIYYTNGTAVGAWAANTWMHLKYFYATVGNTTIQRWILLSPLPVNEITANNMNSVTSNAVNARCNAIGEWFTLIQRTSVPSTATNKTLAYDRKISDYVLILFTIGNSSSNTRETMLIPASQLTVSATVYGFCYVGGVLKEVDIQVISDTVIQVNGDDVLNFGMYGIMKR